MISLVLPSFSDSDDDEQPLPLVSPVAALHVNSVAVHVNSGGFDAMAGAKQAFNKKKYIKVYTYEYIYIYIYIYI